MAPKTTTAVRAAAAASTTVTAEAASAAPASKVATSRAVKATAAPKAPTKTKRVNPDKLEPSSDMKPGPPPKLVNGTAIGASAYLTLTQLVVGQLRNALALLVDHARGGVVTGDMLLALYKGEPLPPAARPRGKKASK